MQPAFALSSLTPHSTHPATAMLRQAQPYREMTKKGSSRLQRQGLPREWGKQSDRSQAVWLAGWTAEKASLYCVGMDANRGWATESQPRCRGRFRLHARSLHRHSLRRGVVLDCWYLVGEPYCVAGCLAQQQYTRSMSRHQAPGAKKLVLVAEAILRLCIAVTVLSS